MINPDSFVAVKLYSVLEKPLDYSFGKPIASHFVDRALHAALIPLSAVACAFDGILGMKDGIICILGGASNFNRWASSKARLEIFEECLSAPFRHAISVLNKDAKFYGNGSFTQEPLSFRNILSTPYNQPYISIEGHGLLTNYLVHKVLRGYAKDSELKNHVIAAKLTYAIAIPSAIVTRVIDFAIGIFATLGAFCTFGTQKSINHLAFRGLQITGIFHDLFFYTTKLVNLEAGRLQ